MIAPVYWTIGEYTEMAAEVASVKYSDCMMEPVSARPKDWLMLVTRMLKPISIP